MNKREMSLYERLALVALSSALLGALGACQKENAIIPFDGQADKTLAQPQFDKNTGDTSNSKPQTDQNGEDRNQKSQ